MCYNFAFKSSDHFYFLTDSVPPNKSSAVLENVTIHSGGDHVNITCHFRNDHSPFHGCVIVIHKSDESILMAKLYQTDTSFPVKCDVSVAGTYFVAVFGWNDGVMEPLAAELQQVDITKGNLYSLCSIYIAYAASCLEELCMCTCSKLSWVCSCFCTHSAFEMWESTVKMYCVCVLYL